MSKGSRALHLGLRMHIKVRPALGTAFIYCTAVLKQMWEKETVASQCKFLSVIMMCFFVSHVPRDQPCLEQRLHSHFASVMRCHSHVTQPDCRDGGCRGGVS